MTKIIILSDLHLGARSGSPVFSSYFNQFFREELFPYMERHSIKNIFQLGDLFDNRTQLSYKAFHQCKPVWFDGLVERDFHMTVLLGNHDIHYRNTLEINSPRLLLGEYKQHISIIDEPSSVKVGSTLIDIVPWICEENSDQVMKFVNRAQPGDVLLGHLELAGFPMYRGSEAKHGMSAEPFKNYRQVFSGHYHTMSEQGNVIYAGIPYQITWSDYADPKGFFVYDTETQEKEFVVNENCMFHKLTYNDGCSYDMTLLPDRYVKLVVQAKTDLVAFDKFLTKLKHANPTELSIVDRDTFVQEASEEFVQDKSTEEFISYVIDDMTTTVDKVELKSFMASLYQEAMTQE